jgi:hypothetical protein
VPQISAAGEAVYLGIGLAGDHRAILSPFKHHLELRLFVSMTIYLLYDRKFRRYDAAK